MVMRVEGSRIDRCPAAQGRDAAAEFVFAAPAPVALDLNGPTTPFARMPEALHDRAIIDIFAEMAARDPSAIAARDPVRRFTRADVLTMALHLAQVIRTRTADDGRVAILLPNGAWYPVAVLGCLAAGRLYAALDPVYPEERNATILAEFKPHCVIGGEAAPSVWADRDMACIDIESLALQRGTPAPATPRDADEPMLVLYTSGSTGTPKGIVNSQRALVQRVVQQVNAAHVCGSDVMLCLASPCTIAGSREMLTALLSGALLLMADPERIGLGGTRRIIREHGVTLVYAVPSLIRAMIGSDESGFDLKSLRVIRLGGEKVTWFDVARLQKVLSPDAYIQVGYSSTETTGAQWFIPRRGSQDGPAPSIGYLLPGLTYAVQGDDGRPVEPGDDGELVICSPFVALGTWRDGRCQPDTVTRVGSSRVLRTGDIVRLRPDGLLEMLGRKDRQIKINGRRVEPAEIEAAMRGAEGVDDAVVLPVAQGGVTIIVGFLEIGKADLHAAVEAARQNLAVAVPGAWHPRRLHPLRAFPRLPSGKIDTSALKILDLSGRDDTTVSEPSGDASRIERIVRDAWLRVLGRRRLPLDLGWDAAGGDSLSFLRLVFELEGALKRVLSLERFRMTMSISDMAAIVDDVAPSEAMSGEERPVVVLLPGLTGDSPSLASFRADLANEVRFVLIDYPPWRRMVAQAMTIGEIAGAVVADILARVPAGRIRLTGYSLGGAIGYEVALHLTRLGRPVDWFAVLDANIESAHTLARTLPPGSVGRAALGLLTGRQSLRQRACQIFATWASHPSRRRLLARLAASRLFERLPAATRFTLEMEICEALQRRALERWIATRPEVRLAARLCLFRSGERRPGTGRDLGWGRLFDEIVIHEVEGDHITMLREPHRAALCRQFLATIPAQDPGTGWHGQAKHETS